MMRQKGLGRNNNNEDESKNDDDNVGATFYSFVYPLPKKELLDMPPREVKQFQQRIRNSLCEKMRCHMHEWEVKASKSSRSKASGNDQPGLEGGNVTNSAAEQPTARQQRPSEPASAVVLLTMTLAISPELATPGSRFVGEQDLLQQARNEAAPVLGASKARHSQQNCWVDIDQCEVPSRSTSVRSHRHRRFGRLSKDRRRIEVASPDEECLNCEDRQFPSVNLDDAYSMEKGLSVCGLINSGSEHLNKSPQQETSTSAGMLNIQLNPKLNNFVFTPLGWPRLDVILLLQQHLATLTEFYSLGLNDNVCSFFKCVQAAPVAQVLSGDPIAQSAATRAAAVHEDGGKKKDKPNSNNNININININNHNNSQQRRQHSDATHDHQQKSKSTNNLSHHHHYRHQSNGLTVDWLHCSNDDWECSSDCAGPTINVRPRKPAAGRSDSPLSPSQQQQPVKPDADQSSKSPTSSASSSCWTRIPSSRTCSCCLGATRHYEASMKAAAKHQATAARLNQKIADKKEGQKKQCTAQEPNDLAKTFEALQGEDEIAKFVAQEFGESEATTIKKKKRKNKKQSALEVAIEQKPTDSYRTIATTVEEKKAIGDEEEKVRTRRGNLLPVINSENVGMRVGNKGARGKEEKAADRHDLDQRGVDNKQQHCLLPSSQQVAANRRQESDMQKCQQTTTAKQSNVTPCADEDVTKEEYIAVLRNAEILAVCASAYLLMEKG